MRSRYLRENKKAEYSIMLINNELISHLLDIDDICRERIDMLVKQMSEKENVNEELKDEKMVEVINGNVYKILYTSKYTTTTTYSYTFKNGCLAISKNTDIKIDRTIISKSKI